MIAICPNCQSHFKVNPLLLGHDGRNVRCMTCEYVWFQAPDAEALLAIIEHEMRSGQDHDEAVAGDVGEIGFENVSANVDNFSEADENSDVSAMLGNIHAQDNHKKRRVVSAVFVGVLFFTCLVYVFASKNTFMERNKGWYAFFGPLGMAQALSAEGLRFDKVVVEVMGKDVRVGGQIINTRPEHAEVPYIRVELMNKDGVVVSRWIDRPPDYAVAGESVIAFDFNNFLDDVDNVEDIQDAKIHFTVLEQPL